MKYTFMHVSVCVQAYVRAYVCVYALYRRERTSHVPIHVHVQTNAHASTRTRTRTHADAHAHTHEHTRTCARTHTRIAHTRYCLSHPSCPEPRLAIIRCSIIHIVDLLRCRYLSGCLYNIISCFI